MRGGIGLTKYGESGRQCGYFRHEQIRMSEEVTFKDLKEMRNEPCGNLGVGRQRRVSKKREQGV